jgi:hypothetical protein
LLPRRRILELLFPAHSFEPKLPHYVFPMTKLAEIQEAIQHLRPEERSELRHWILEAETPEMLAAIDVGIRSAKIEPKLSAEDLRRKLHGWTTRSSQ